MKKILDLLIQPATIAFVVTIIIILFLPPIFNKYVIRTIEEKKISDTEIISYCDLDSDGFSEKIIYTATRENDPSFIVKNKGKTIDQWNLKGAFLGGNFFIYCDYNFDSINEMFVFTIRNDSIFITGIDPFNNEKHHFFNMFIDICRPYNGRYNCVVVPCANIDKDGDGYSELVIEVNTGMSRQPRNLYLIDILNDQVIKSPESGTSIHEPFIFDLNNDGQNEFMGDSFAHGNFKSVDSIDYPDTCAWLMVLDTSMNFIFNPVKFGMYKTCIDVEPFRPFNKNYLVVLQKHQGTENIGNKLILFDDAGNRLKERTLDDFDGVENSFLLSPNLIADNLFLFLSNGNIEQIDSDLMTIKRFDLPDILFNRPIQIDLDMDGKDEFIFTSFDGQGIIITRNDFLFPVKLEFSNDKIEGISYYSLIKQVNRLPYLYFQIKGSSFIIEYGANPLYSIKYLIWSGIFLVAYVLLFLLQKVQIIRAKKKVETEQKIASLQLKSIKGQTDPHFTLNLIDSIGNLFYKQDSEKAAYVFGKYAKLLRTTIISSEKISTSLKDELEYVRNYIDLEIFRYDDKFSYTIEIDNNLSVNTMIPKMLIHTFVENAIKHGFKHKDGLGMLEISAKKLSKLAEIRIKDNGVGRQKAKEYSKLSTGKGLQILNNMLDLYYDLRKVRITYLITDLKKTETEPEGTLITINIPLKT